MLQISTGKFYSNEDCFHTECKGILYSNVSLPRKSDLGPISIERTSNRLNEASYVISFDLKMQNTHNSIQMIKVGDDVVIDQAKNILAFAIDGVFEEEKEIVEKVCREGNGRNSRVEVAADFTGDLLKRRRIEEKELKQAEDFVEKLIELSRVDYKKILKCIVTYNESLKWISTDISMAYSMLVFCLESLAQGNDKYVSTWSDYDQDKKSKLEKVFKDIPQDCVEQIKEILIEGQHFKLMQRFKNFVTENVSDDFYRYQINRSVIDREEFPVALGNAYNIRSKYAHMLKPMLKHLSNSSFSKDSDVFEYQHNVFFTYGGLLRLVREVIKNFVYSCPAVKAEEYDWQSELPGCYEVQLAPQYWIWKKASNRGVDALPLLEGLINCLVNYPYKIPDMEENVSIYLNNLSQMKAEHKLAAYALCCIYCSMVQISEDNKETFEYIIKKNGNLLKECTLYALILSVMPHQILQASVSEIIWESEEYEKILESYRKKKFKQNRIKLPNKIEILLYLQLANSYKDDGNDEKQKQWLKNAFDISNNLPDIQMLIDACISSKGEFEIEKVFGIIFSQGQQEKGEFKE